MYIGSAGPGPGGRTDGRADGRRAGGRTAGGRAGQAPARVDGQTGGRADDGCPRPGGRAAGPILNDSATIFIDFHEKLQKTLSFSVALQPGGRTADERADRRIAGVCGRADGRQGRF